MKSMENANGGAEGGVESVKKREREREKLITRKPLSDCTNKPRPLSSSSSSSSSPISKSNTTPNPKISPKPKPNTPPPPHLVDADCENSKTFTSFTGRQSKEKEKNKGKAVAVAPFSCPPPTRTKSIVDESEERQHDPNEQKKELRGIRLSKTCTIDRPKKMRRFSMPALPRDFIAEQKEYFAEVDAFKLEEEVISESELE